jgi:hypothetical protein
MIANILQNLTQSGGSGAAFMTTGGGFPMAVGGPGGGGGGAAGGNVFGFPMNMFQIHGNPGTAARNLSKWDKTQTVFQGLAKPTRTLCPVGGRP